MEKRSLFENSYSKLLKQASEESLGRCW